MPTRNRGTRGPCRSTASVCVLNRSATNAPFFFCAGFPERDQVCAGVPGKAHIPSFPGMRNRSFVVMRNATAAIRRLPPPEPDENGVLHCSRCSCLEISYRPLRGYTASTFAIHDKALSYTYGVVGVSVMFSECLCRSVAARDSSCHRIGADSRRPRTRLCKIVDDVIRVGREKIHAFRFPQCSIRKRHTLQLDRSDSGQFVGTAIRSDESMRKENSMSCFDDWVTSIYRMFIGLLTSIHRYRSKEKSSSLCGQR